MSFESESASDPEGNPQKPANRRGKKVEDIYKKTNLREHILNRPDSYIGTLEQDSSKLFVLNDYNTKFIQREVKYVPGLLKIFDEILVNAADNKQRDPKGMTELRVNVDKAKNIISVYNNGQGIPIQIHKEYNIYVPHLIFGQLLTSSNYDDTEKRTVGGRNGFGAKLTNIFSTKFVIETCDGKKQYKQVFKDNMSTILDPDVEKADERRSWTRVTYQPDLARFGMQELEDDIIALIKKRTYDIAGTSGKGLKVYYNNQALSIKDFKSYCEMHLDEPQNLIYEQLNDRWEVGIAPADGTFTQVSFVNRINTFRGGSHVAYMTDQCVKILTETVLKKNKNNTLKPQHFKNHMWVFVNSLIENPTFDTQTKVNLTTRPKDFGGVNPSISDTFQKKLSKSVIVSAILSFAQFQESKELKKNDSKKKIARLVGIPKLEDANKAGTRESDKCTLILTEGDSAKALAMSGLSIVGRDFYGVFPLRGKVLNVRDASAKSVAENAEITYLKQIIGLQQNMVYTDASQLRYGHIMIMTDQDHDGSHIKGLLINLFATFWPSLLKMDGFLSEFITPIVKVAKGKNVSQARDARSFFTLQEYENWKVNTANSHTFSAKYYKGLGTSTAAEARVYFSDINTHQIPFEYVDEKCTKLIEMAFAKTAADERKLWIQQYEQGTYIDHNVASIPYQEFINKELVIFSIASNTRAIPSIVDGLKPSERKILFSCFKRKLTKEMKVAQLVGYVAEHSAYHHGEQSLGQTIIALAQNFVGSNNINYLWPSGQFGTRAGGGKDAASARYIFTYLSPITRTIFHPQDDPLLNYLNDDGQSIEPEYYVPVIPTVLVNGSSGIGTGWSSEISNHNPREIILNIRKMLAGDQPTEMHPWYKGFIGELAIRPSGKQYYTRGLYEIIHEKPNTVHIYELPVNTWTQQYKADLDEKMKNGEVLELAEYHTDTVVSFLVTFSEAYWAKSKTMGMLNFLGLESSKSNTNMVLFNKYGQITKYNSTTEILQEFYDVRLDLYSKRKIHLIDTMERELNKIDNKVRFIRAVIKEEIKIRNIKGVDLLARLEAMKFDPIITIKSTDNSIEGGDNLSSDGGSDSESDSNDEMTPKNKTAKITKKNQKQPQSVSTRLKGFHYLTSLPLIQLTFEKVQELESEKAKQEALLDLVKKKSPEDMWGEDLDALEIALDDHEARELVELRQGQDGMKRSTARRPAQRKKMDDSDYDNSDSDEYAPKKRKPAAKKGKAADKSTKIPTCVKECMEKRPTTQSYFYEKESEAEMKKRLRAEAKAAAKLNDVADLLGIEGLEDDTPSSRKTTSKKTPAEPKSKRATKSPAIDDDDSDDEPQVPRAKSTRVRTSTMKVNLDEYDSDFIGSDTEDDDSFDSGSESSESDYSSEDEKPKKRVLTKKTTQKAEPAPKKAPAKKEPITTTKRKAPVSKAKKAQSETESESDSDYGVKKPLKKARTIKYDDSDDSHIIPPKKKAPTKKVTQTVVESDEDSDFAPKKKAPVKNTSPKTTSIDSDDDISIPTAPKPPATSLAAKLAAKGAKPLLGFFGSHTSIGTTVGLNTTPSTTTPSTSLKRFSISSDDDDFIPNKPTKKIASKFMNDSDSSD